MITNLIDLNLIPRRFINIMWFAIILGIIVFLAMVHPIIFALIICGIIIILAIVVVSAIIQSTKNQSQSNKNFHKVEKDSSYSFSNSSKYKKHSGKYDGNCANCPPHYGYRYGRWYYAHNHMEGCEFGGNQGSGGRD